MSFGQISHQALLIYERIVRSFTEFFFSMELLNIYALKSNPNLIDRSNFILLDKLFIVWKNISWRMLKSRVHTSTRACVVLFPFIVYPSTLVPMREMQTSALCSIRRKKRSEQLHRSKKRKSTIKVENSKVTMRNRNQDQ